MLDLRQHVLTLCRLRSYDAWGACTAIYNFLSALHGLTGVIAGVKRGEERVVG